MITFTLKSLLKPSVFLLLACFSAACSTDNPQPNELVTLINQLNNSAEDLKSSSNSEVVYGKQLSDINGFLKDSLKLKINRWPGIITDIKEHSDYFSFAVLIPLTEFESDAGLRFQSLVLPGNISKTDTVRSTMLRTFKNGERVFVSGSMLTDDESRPLSRSYSSYVDNLFVNPVIEISSPLITHRNE